MSAEMISPAGGPLRRRGGPRLSGAGLRPVVGVLADGTACYAPIGEVVVEGSLVTCHMCGRSFRSVTAHLSAHGWTKRQYCQAFGLEVGQSLEGPETRKLRAAAFTARLLFEPAVRQGSAAGRQRARGGELARDAAAAARGRPFSQQRRAKAALAGAAAASPGRLAAISRTRADRRLLATADEVARQRGYPDIRAFVLARTRDGESMAAISREAGLHKDWLSRHLSRLDPAGADAVRRYSGQRPDLRWQPVLQRLGYPDVASYLRERHLQQHQTVNAMAGEVGLSHHAVTAALRRHGLAQVAHAAKRHEAVQRATAVAGRLGYADVAAYISARRSAGWTWKAIAAESGQPESWLRRHAPAAQPSC
ncbi:MAG TPA: MucR family transcriptional regulator [Streptosporangiaceae bacterium]|nr:MucR family transcriptional regulator [Streptosporangiaceae bacterium]